MNSVYLSSNISRKSLILYQLLDQVLYCHYKKGLRQVSGTTALRLFLRTVAALCIIVLQ